MCSCTQRRKLAVPGDVCQWAEALKTKSTVEDDSKLFTWDSTASTLSALEPSTRSIDNINIDKGTQTVRFGLTIGAGAEYSLSGNTALFFQLNWNYFIFNGSG